MFLSAFLHISGVTCVRGWGLGLGLLQRCGYGAYWLLHFAFSIGTSGKILPNGILIYANNGWISVFYSVLLWCHAAQTSAFSPLNVCGTSSIPPHMYKNSYHIHSIANTAMQSVFLTQTGILKYLQDLNAFTHVHIDKLYNISVMLYYSISFGMSCRPINTFMLELICSSMHFYNDTFSWSREIHETYLKIH